MKIKFSHEMRKRVWMYILVLTSAITIYFAFEKFSIIWNALKTLCSLLTPFILGFSLAFLLNKPMEMIEVNIFSKLPLSKKQQRNFSAISAMTLGIFVASLFFVMLIPQIIESISSLISDLPTYIKDTQAFINSIIQDSALVNTQLAEYLSQDNLLNTATEFVTGAVPKIFKVTFQLGSIFLDTVLGIMAGIYMMIDKERLMGYIKKICYALCPLEMATYLHRMTITSGHIFNNFIIGKAIDSLIIGVLCYVGSLIFQFPYALLLSVFVGVTNMIPVFGPFIGAVPGIVILFIIHPITALYFAFFIFCLQQLDGNIIGPLILGDKLGMPSIGILFSVCIGGGLFGVVGMFIGVPCFAIIYAAVREFVNYRLHEKELTDEQLTYVDDETLPSKN